MDEERSSFNLKKKKDLRRKKTAWIRAAIALMIPMMINGKDYISIKDH